MNSETTIFKADTEMGFGAGACSVEVSLIGDNFLTYKEGNPQTGAKKIWAIKDCSKEIIDKIRRLGGSMDSAEWLKNQYAQMSTHFYKGGKWLERLD